MAIELILRCFHPLMPVEGGAEQVVLIRLCEIARRNGDRVVVSMETLAAHCHCSEKHVRTQVRRLEAKGLIQRPKDKAGRVRKGTGPNHCNVYWVTLPELPALPPIPFHAEPTAHPEVHGENGPQRTPSSGVAEADTAPRVPVAPHLEVHHTAPPGAPHRTSSSDILPSVTPPPPRACEAEDRINLIAAWVGGGGWTSFKGDDQSEMILAAIGDHTPERVTANLALWRRPGGEPIHLPGDYQRIRERIERKTAERARAAAAPAPAPEPERPRARSTEGDALLAAERMHAVEQHGALWERVVAASGVGESSHRLWLSSRKVWPRRVDGARLVLAVPTVLFAQIIPARFGAALTAALAQALGVERAELVCEVALVPELAGV